MCDVEKRATSHKVAVFVFEAEATDYCAYRNEMMKKYETDDVSAIERPNDKDEPRATNDN